MAPADRRTVIRALIDLFAPLTEPEADQFLRSAGLGSTPGGWGQGTDQGKRITLRQILTAASDDALEKLAGLLPDYDEPSVTSEPDLDSLPTAEVKCALDGPIFVVHGHARAPLHETVRVLERGTGREVIVLHEQANAGRTILEKFEDHSADASFAVVLLTGDDEGGVRAGTNKQLRGRQNVIFELGFFFGKLGRRRVAVLLEENVEKPSDIDGLVISLLMRRERGSKPWPASLKLPVFR